MEHAKLAAAVWLLRSRTKSDSAESPHGSSGGSAMRRGVCFVPRDVARQAPHSPFRVQHGLALPRISRRREALRRVQTRPPDPRPPRPLIVSGTPLNCQASRFEMIPLVRLARLPGLDTNFRATTRGSWRPEVRVNVVLVRRQPIAYLRLIQLDAPDNRSIASSTSETPRGMPASLPT